MLVLGIESSCDETAAALVLSDGTVLADVVHSQIDIHRVHGGVVPELAARDHERNIEHVVRETFVRAGVGWEAVDAIAVTARPGLVGALLVGVEFAKGLSLGTGKPLLGVDHLVGHLLSIFVKRDGEAALGEDVYPYVALLVSGGHTSIFRVNGPLPEQITELGGTRDDAAGEAYDKVGKLLGLGYPGGPVVDRYAAFGDPSRFPLETPMGSLETLEFSFSGIKTQVAHLVERQKKELSEEEKQHLCASFQTTVVEVLVRKLFEAARREGVNTVVLGGGVAANSALRASVLAQAKERGLRAVVPPFSNCTDNAAMIAYVGAQWAERGRKDDLSLQPTSKTILERTTRKGRGDR